MTNPLVTRPLAAAVLALTSMAAFPAPARGQTIPELGRAHHVVIPQTRSFRLDSTRDDIEIRFVRANVSIDEQTARTTLDIAIDNPSDRQQEAVLLLPVPDGAVVTAFAFEGASAEPTAEILPREGARRLYDQIVSRLLDPALVEFAGYNLIRSSVFPVPAGGAQRLQVTYEHLLESDDSRVDYVLPRSESLAQSVPWEIALELSSAHPVASVYSPSHILAATRKSERSFAVRVDSSGLATPGPFRLSYLLDRGPVSASLFAYPDPSIGGGYFLLMAGLPAEDRGSVPPAPREVTVVVDRSGSMAGEKMDQARAAVLQVIEGLGDDEAFNIIDYASGVSSFAPSPVIRGTSRAREARAYLDALRPGGGTNIHDALLEALRQPPTDGRLPIVLFLTDGLPTIGRTGEAVIRDMVGDANVHGRRVFTIGVGADVNAPLLDRIAGATRATATYVLPGQDVELEVARVFKRLSGPVFAEPKLGAIDTAGHRVDDRLHELIPEALPDLFDGDQLIVLGQYRGDGPIVLELAGDHLGVERSFTFVFDLDRATTRHAFVPRLWASRRIAQLIDLVRQDGALTMLHPRLVGSAPLDEPKQQRRIDEIVRLSTEFGILTEYTAFFATEGTDLGDLSSLQVGCGTHLDNRAVRTRWGAGAVNQALNYARQIDQRTLNPRNTYMDANFQSVDVTAVQQRCDRAFFQRGDRWIDSRLIIRGQIAEPTRSIMLGSPEHFELLRRFVRQGRQGILSLSGEILILDGHEVVLITGGC